MKSPITTHVLDTAAGQPAEGVPIHLSVWRDGGWDQIGEGVTNNDGRITDLLAPGQLSPGTYRMVFETAKYFEASKSAGFYPYVPVIFEVVETDQHYHVPLLLSPFGYSTYRGS